MTTGQKARLVLQDGTVFEGVSVGASGEAGGEIVFNTSMTGYQEILTDPSYRGQIVTMTYPLIGNYGTVPAHDESERPWVEGFVMRELAPRASNFQNAEDLPAWLERNGVVAIAGIDTRQLTRRIRREGAMKALISTGDRAADELMRRMADVPELEGRDLVRDVSRKEVTAWKEGYAATFAPAASPPEDGASPHLVVVDYGCKANILRSLVAHGFRVTVAPAWSTAPEILALEPDGVLLSNGPGDPRALDYAVQTTRDLLGRLPLFGICLGHQILGAALGAEIFKLKFGHHGGNHPVKDLDSGRVEITAQNHGFAVEESSLERLGGRVTHVNLNDDTVAGLTVPDRRAFSIQFHPEASPGPHDSLGIFKRMRSMLAGTECAG